MSQQAVPFQIHLCGRPLHGLPDYSKEFRLQHMIQLYATTAVQNGFYLPLYSVLFYSAFLWSGYVVQKYF
jgi:hypothetical protein